MATSLSAPAVMIPLRADLDGYDASTVVRKTLAWCGVPDPRRARGAQLHRHHVSPPCPAEAEDRMLVVMTELIALPAEMKRQIGDANTRTERSGCSCPTGRSETPLRADRRHSRCSARAVTARRWPARSLRMCGQTTTTASCQLLNIDVLDSSSETAPPRREKTASRILPTWSSAAWSSQNDRTVVEQLQEDAGVLLDTHGGEAHASD
jgi:hypothetical protein